MISYQASYELCDEYGPLTHWGRVTHICVGNLTIIDSDNGLSPGRHQAIIWTNARVLLIGPLGTNFSEILIEIQTFSFRKNPLKVSSAKWRPFCLGLNELNGYLRCPSWFKRPSHHFIMWDTVQSWELHDGPKNSLLIACLVLNVWQWSQYLLLNILTGLMLKQEQPQRIMSMPWVLMPWPPTSP